MNDRPRRAQGDQLVGVHRQVARRQRAAVLEEVAGHPMIFARSGEVLDQLAEIAAVQLRPALARGADEADREALVVGHRDERRLAVARQPLDPDLLGVDGLVGLEVVQGAARAPGPGAQRAPIVGLARLPFVAQADDSLGQARAVVGLDAVRDDDGVAPALGEDQRLPRRAEGPEPAALRSPPWASPSWPPPRPARPRAEPPQAELHHHRHRALRVRRRRQRELDVDLDLRAPRVVDVPTSLLVTTATSPTFSCVVPATPISPWALPWGPGRRPRGRSPRRSPAGAWSTTARRIVTFVPSLQTSGSGSVNGLTFDSS